MMKNILINSELQALKKASMVKKLIIVSLIVLLCSLLNSCKKKYHAGNQNEQVEFFLNKNGEDYISKKDLLLLVKNAQMKINEKPSRIEIYQIVPPVPPEKRGIIIYFSAKQMVNSEVRRFVTFNAINILNNKRSIYLGRKKHQDGKWYSIYEDGDILEEEGVKWADLGVSEYEYYKFKFDDGAVFCQRKYEELSYEKVKSILLYLKKTYRGISAFEIRKIEDGYKVEMPSRNKPYEGIWIKIIDNGDSYKIIDKGEYVF